MRHKQRSSRVLAFILALTMLLPMGTTAIAAETELPTGDSPPGVAETIDGEAADWEAASSPAAAETELTTGSLPSETIGGAGGGETAGETTSSQTGVAEKDSTAKSLPSGVTENEGYGEDTNMIGTEQNDDDSVSDNHFDAMTPFTLADMEGYSVKMDDAEIPIEYFQLEGENEQDKENPCTLSFAEGLTSISGGMIQNHAPATVNNTNGQAHAFSYAHVGNTRVYYMGTLEIYEDDTVQHYIYYTTDTHITNKTVYAVLKENEKISLVYNHGIYHTVEYQLQDKNGQPVEADTEGWTEDGIFGANRAYAVADGKPFSAEITIPRGYKATVTVQRKDGAGEIYEKKLGEMMAYWQPNAPTGYNTIALRPESPTSMVLTDSFSIENVTSDMVVTVKYEKVTEIKFNAYMWTLTSYAKNRIAVKNSDGQYGTASTANSNLTTQGNSFTWEFDGITAREGNAYYTWEMDQLQINGERIRVPMTTLPNTENSVTETTTLSTGTVVTLTVQSSGGTNGRDGKRHYILKIDNCYEDLTISGGNMVGHIHREFVIHRLQGLDDPQSWPNKGAASGGWGTLKPNTLIDKRNEPYNIAAPFRFKRAVGYENMHVRFTTKERGTVLQEDANCSGNSPYIEYLIRKDVESSADKLQVGVYETVAYSEWKASEDGYFYFRATNALDTFMKKDNQNGVVLISIYADPIKAGINYIDGAGDGDSTGPLAANIDIMPQYQSGGENGYNILNNATALVSNQVPVDKAGKWTFSHWEIAVVKDGKLTDESKKDEQDAVIKVHPGDDIHVSEMAMKYLEDCLYRDEQKDRIVLTLKAVWQKSVVGQPIPYIVRYVLVDIDGTETQIEEHTHTVNVGAMLVTDLYQDTKKTLSESIKAVLEGDNDYHKDYTLEGNWKVDERKTTKKIPSVNPENNVATIYLVKQATSVTVTKVWNDYNSPTRPASVEVQLYKNAIPFGAPVTLSAGNWSHTFTGLPEIENGNPIVYTVKEVTKLDEYTANVAASSNAPNQITITNTKKTGNLTVSKTVAGIGGDENRDFQFTVTLNNSSISGIFGDMSFVDGKASFSLKHGESKTAAGLPVGITYEVSETGAGQNGYITSHTGANGTLTEAGAVASFTNTRKTGGLTVSKTVIGNGGETERDFNFTVTLSDTSINGTFGNMTFTNGAAEFTLRHNESKTATGLPTDIAYEVVETEANRDGYVTTSMGTSGTITEAGAVASFTNTKKVGDLTVSKIVAGNSGEPERDFNFQVKLSNTSVNGTFGEMTFKNGVATFTLRHNQSKTATGLPVDITYEVTETEADQDGYTTASEGASGTITEAGAAASFTNEKEELDPGPEPIVLTGDLTVSKTVSGNQGDTNQEFTFTVTLDDRSIEGQYGDMVFHNGVATFKLKHGESISAFGLPADVHYVVEESDNEGYTVTASGDTGTIEDGETAAAKFNNHKDGSTPPPPITPDPDKPPKPDPDVPGGSEPVTPEPGKPSEPSAPPVQNPPTGADSPQTGDSSNLWLWLTLLFISGGGIIGATFYGKKKQRTR